MYCTIYTYIHMCMYDCIHVCMLLENTEKRKEKSGRTPVYSQLAWRHRQQNSSFSGKAQVKRKCFFSERLLDCITENQYCELQIGEEGEFQVSIVVLAAALSGIWFEHGSIYLL